MYQNIEKRLKPGENGIRHLGWKRYVHITPQARSELSFWIQNIKKVNEHQLWRDVYSQALEINLGTDASRKGWGEHVFLPPGQQISQMNLERMQLEK